MTRISAKRAAARHELAKDLIFIVIGVIAAIALVQTGMLDALLGIFGRTDMAAFLAGVFFTSAFTIAPASIALAHIATEAPVASIALWGALGAMLGDLIIFFFIRDRFAADIKDSLKPSVARHIMGSFHLGFLKWLSPVIGALIIASPIPDEFGLTLLGISRTRVAVLLPISFAMNWLGIYLIVAIAPRRLTAPMRSDYTYNLPDSLIAHAPAEPRDSARLMAYSAKTGEVILDTFANIARFMPADSVLAVNDTRVVPARLTLAKLTGGAVRVLFLMNEWDGTDTIRGLPDKGIRIGEALYLDQHAVAEAVSHKAEEFTFKLRVSPREFEKLCMARGETPLPPYIHSGLPEAALRSAIRPRSRTRPAPWRRPPRRSISRRASSSRSPRKASSAPTSPCMWGRGTFSPVTPEAEAAGALHSEPVMIGAEASAVIAAAKKAGKPVVAAGTTALRALESAAASVRAGEAYSGETSLFIRPPYEFKVVDGLITNFHLPGTSLLMLLDAFLQAKGSRRSWRDLYAIAVREKFRFYSFGDAMLII